MGSQKWGIFAGFRGGGCRPNNYSTLIYVLKNCHQHSNGFENLMSSWGVGVSLSKLPYERVFLKNNTKSIGFQMVIWSQNLRFSYFSFGLIFIAVGGAAARKILAELLTKPAVGARKILVELLTKPLHSPFGVQRLP